MFDGFVTESVDVGEARLRVRWSSEHRAKRGAERDGDYAGTGPAVLLLHGHPRTSATWHRVAPLMVDFGYTVVCPDLRGYGQSSKPETTADHAPYSKRAMAGDMMALMGHLGHRDFVVAGHDRGSYVAFRLALDHPEAVRRLAVLDSVPISEALARCNDRFATAWWHWFFFAQPDKPERAINADPDAWYGGSAEAMGTEAYEDYRLAIHNPATVHAMLEDYRAGLGIDRDHEIADREAGRRLTCPVLVLWSSRDDMEDLYGDPLSVWRDWAGDLRGNSIDSGHHMAEQAPAPLAHALHDFIRS